MRGFLIFLIMIIGFGLVVKTFFELQNQKRYMFKNISILKKQRISQVIGMIGALILIVTLLIWLFK